MSKATAKPSLTPNQRRFVLKTAAKTLPLKRNTKSRDRRAAIHPVVELRLDQLVGLRRNPQYQTPHQQTALAESIRRDGFWAPIVVRRLRGHDRYEVISGNHRVAAAREAGLASVSCVVAKVSDQQAARIAVNANTIHGEPEVALLAPFLADLDEETLRSVHLEDELIAQLKSFDEELAETLKKMQAPEEYSKTAGAINIPDCECPQCGRRHVSKSSPDE